MLYVKVPTDFPALSRLAVCVSVSPNGMGRNRTGPIDIWAQMGRAQTGWAESGGHRRGYPDPFSIFYMVHPFSGFGYPFGMGLGALEWFFLGVWVFLAVTHF